MTQIPRRRVLVIDDDPDVRDLVATLCRQAGVAIDQAGDAQSGIDRARQQRPDLILLDLKLPDRSGIEVARVLRADPTLAAIPVVMLSAHRTERAKVAAFEAGADDYVVKPFSLAEIDARIRANLRKRELYERLEKANRELQRANERLAELATTDELTGLCNMRHLRHRLGEEYLRAERYETTLSVVMVDLDGFKAINDTRGHAAGDRLLAEIGRRLRAQARATDIVGRYGGDEFAFVLPHTDLDEALGFARRLIERFNATPLLFDDGERAPIGLSCGVATYPITERSGEPEKLLAAADEAMYRAKREGGARVAAAPTAGAK
ncbi:MAG: diguanylate cyclase [Acidobacteriota bacterium]|nr:MAG: diguanylate cyclase [Acidobacteriota bacterium]